MGNNEVSIRLSTFDRTRSAEVTLDRNFSISDLIEESKKNWALPSDTQYHVLNETRGMQLQSKQNLSTDVVSQGDHLIIQPMLVAGSMPSRLKNDQERLDALVRSHQTKLQVVHTTGTPPDFYRIRFNLKSIERIDANGGAVYRQTHLVTIKLPANYPMPGSPPEVHMEQPLFHPHVFIDRRVCIGKHHVVGEFLDKFVQRLASIITFDPKYFDFNSPANKQALDWVKTRLNTNLFPTDEFETAKPSGPSIQWKNV